MDYRLDAIAVTVAQHYRLLKSIVCSSDKIRMLSDQEARDADYLADVIERIAGKRLANYCRQRFQQGWMQGDLRSYKIKFVFTNLRNHLQDCPAKEELIARLNELTEYAEQLAGCKPDGKRRNKKAVAERAQRKSDRQAAKRAKEEARKAKEKSTPVQLELFAETSITEVSEKIPESDKKPSHPRKTVRVKSEDRYDKMASEIIKSEYGEDDDDDDDTRETDESYSYGTHFGDETSVYGCDDGDNW